MAKFSRTSGFTLLELLVVVGVIVFLSTMSLVVFSQVRRLSRDTVRLTHITQLQTALRAYFRDQGVYPTAVVAGGSIATTTTTYMELVPAYPRPADGSCASGSTYAYTQDSAGASYHINFCLGNMIANVPAGNNILTPAGIITAP
ncbi:MAG: prepilin-type N-terminal cleavage/methylation domain-containing protein [Candidatus Falkowbacteria bacterium]